MSTQTEKHTIIKISGVDQAFMDDVAATIHNSYRVVDSSRVFRGVKYSLDNPEVFMFLHIVPLWRKS